MRGERSCELRLQLARPSASLPNSPPAHLLNSLSAHFLFLPAAHIGFFGYVEKFDFLELRKSKQWKSGDPRKYLSRNQNPSHPKCGPSRN